MDTNVVCEVCSILNMHGGLNCAVCNAQLPKPNESSQHARVRNHRLSMQVVSPMQAMGSDFGPPDGKWLCSLPYRSGGTFRAFVKDSVTVMDQQTWSQTAVYVLGCEFTKGITYQEQWDAGHAWAWFEKWHRKMLEQKLVPGAPPFPQVDEIEASSISPATMAKLEQLLSAYMGELLSCVKDAETFLASDLADKLFKIKDNIQDEINFDLSQDAYQEVLSADMSSESTVPLLRRGLALCVLDRDPDNEGEPTPREPTGDQKLVPRALDVLELLENAIRIFNDTITAAQTKVHDIKT